MRREGPEDIFLAPDPSEIEPIRIEVLQPAEGAVVYQLAQFEEGRVVLQQMSDHQFAVPALGQSQDLLRLGPRKGQRLLHKDMLPGLDRGARKGRVLDCRSGDRDAGNRRVAPYRVEPGARCTVLLRQSGRGRLVDIAYRPQRPQFGK